MQAAATTTEAPNAGNANPGTPAAVGTPPVGDSGAPAQGAGQSTGGTPAGQSVSSDWLTGVPEATKAYVTSKGFKDVNSVITSYQNFEKLQGVPAENVLKLPTKPDDTEGWNAVYNKLGRPAKAEEYQLPIPEKGGDPEFAKWASETFHEVGVSKSQAQKIVEKWNGQMGKLLQMQQEAAKTKGQAEETALKTEWGGAFQQNVGVAQNAAAVFGLNDQQINAIEQALGFAATMKLFHTLGTRVGEDKFVTGGGGRNFSSVMTPDQAKAEISRLKGDTDFVTRYLRNEPEQKERMAQLHKMAYPESA